MIANADSDAIVAWAQAYLEYHEEGYLVGEEADLLYEFDEDDESKAKIASVLLEMKRERDALALQVAHEWGWPDAESVLTRLSGDRTSALATFTEEALRAYLGVA